jgi:hypothetical protein
MKPILRRSFVKISLYCVAAAGLSGGTAHAGGLWLYEQASPDLATAGAGAASRAEDAEREYAYDRDSSVGRLDKALDAAQAAGWMVVSMRSDWKLLFASEWLKAQPAFLGAQGKTAFDPDFDIDDGGLPQEKAVIPSGAKTTP